MSVESRLFSAVQFASGRSGAKLEEVFVRTHRQMPRLLIGIHLITHGLSAVQFVLGEVFAELFKTSIVMIPDVRVGLTQLLSDLCERIAFEKVQPERLSLILG